MTQCLQPFLTVLCSLMLPPLFPTPRITIVFFLPLLGPSVAPQDPVTGSHLFLIFNLYLRSIRIDWVQGDVSMHVRTGWCSDLATCFKWKC